MKTTNTGSVARPPWAADLDRAECSAGFTLLELLITMAVAAILLTIAVPVVPLRHELQPHRRRGQRSARRPAVRARRGDQGRAHVTVCVSTDGSTCANSTAWQSGWIVFSEPEQRRRARECRRDPPAAASRLLEHRYLRASQDVSAITFNRDGYAVGIANGTLINLHDSTGNTAWTRCASIALSGEMTTELYGVTNNGVTCT